MQFTKACILNQPKPNPTPKESNREEKSLKIARRESPEPLTPPRVITSVNFVLSQDFIRCPCRSPRYCFHRRMAHKGYTFIKLQGR